MPSEGKGKTLELFLVDGRADGMRTAAVFNWTGHTLVTPFGKIALDNKTAPPLPTLTEAAQSSMETFLHNILTVLPALGVDYFVKDTRSEPPPDAPLFQLHFPKYGIQATAAQLDNGEFVVQADSLARKIWAGSAQSYAGLYKELVDTGILQMQGEHRVFQGNCAFKSTSAAASVVKGYSSVGPIEWKLKGQNKTYKQWEAEELASDSSGTK